MLKLIKIKQIIKILGEPESTVSCQLIVYLEGCWSHFKVTVTCSLLYNSILKFVSAVWGEMARRAYPALYAFRVSQG